MPAGLAKGAATVGSSLGGCATEGLRVVLVRRIGLWGGA